MYIKLALRNVKRSFKDYAIYFFTLMFGVCIFYVFNSIDSQQTMMELSKSQDQLIDSLKVAMQYTSTFISIILGFLIVYATRYLIKRRKKELGIYQTLGMGKSQIATIINIETVFIAVLSLAIGLSIGVFLSQGFAVLTASLFQVKLKNFVFIFSPGAAKKAVFYFGITFVLVMVLSSIDIGRQKLIELIYADRKNERFKAPRLFLSVILFLLSLACLGTAYYLIITYDFSNLLTFLILILLGVCGTFLFFLSLSGFTLKIFQSNKKLYYNNLNMFVLRQINSKIGTNFATISMVCLMLFMCITTFCTGISVSREYTEQLNKKTPYDANITVTLANKIYDNKGEIVQQENIDVNLQSYFDKQSVPIENYAKEYVFTKYYQGDEQITVKYNDNDVLFYPHFIKLSDFNKLLKMQNKSPVSLLDNEVILNCASEQIKQDLINYEAQKNFNYFGKELKFNGFYDYVLANENIGITFVVRDELLEKSSNIVSNKLSLNYIEQTQTYEEMFIAQSQEIKSAIINSNKSYSKSYSQRTKIGTFENLKSIAIMTAYIAVYIGIVFLVISATMLSIIQLSETSDNKKRYTLLQKLGADDKMIKKALFSQIAVFFIAPMALAVVHSTVAIYVVNKMIPQMNTMKISIIILGLIATIYFGYFLATYFGSKKFICSKLSK